MTPREPLNFSVVVTIISADTPSNKGLTFTYDGT